MWLRATCSLLFFTTITVLLKADYKSMPPEKRLQMCQALQKELNSYPNFYGKPNQLWPYGKACIAITTAAGITYGAYSLAPSTTAARDLAHKQSNLIKLRNVLKVLRPTKTIDNTQTSNQTLTIIQPIPLYWLGLTFVAMSSAFYLLLSKFYDQKMHSHKATVKKFLTLWPDFVEYAPDSFKEDVRPLYAAYLQDGDSVIANERTAALIILAFNVFLTGEIEAISQSLS